MGYNFVVAIYFSRLCQGLGQLSCSESRVGYYILIEDYENKPNSMKKHALVNN